MQGYIPYNANMLNYRDTQYVMPFGSIEKQLAIYDSSDADDEPLDAG